MFPAEAYPEKEGTVTHPDGRIQRLRPAVAHVGESRAEWQVIAELAQRVGLDLACSAAPWPHNSCSTLCLDMRD